ncbi:MAG: MMPL family transporter [SAR202 cluster bacterium]|nr:MMPL family transporter [SAR202 cluster bacterium]MDP6801503.1 MMPL family transporter [SAR202 cluster bacterium]
MTVDNPRFQGFVESIFEEITGLGTDVVEGGFHFYLVGQELLVSEDRRSTLIPLTMAGNPDEAHERIDEIHEVAHQSDGREGFQVLVTGEATLSKDFIEISEDDLLTGEMFGVPIALVIMVVVFGAVVASFVPLLIAFVSIALALGVAAIIGQVFTLSVFVQNMATLIGLAVGIDYSLFILERFREERAIGRDKGDAVVRAAATAGRAVFFSGMTVMLALLGLFFVPTDLFWSLAIGAILVVAAAVLASLTLLPAVLYVLGDRVNALKLPLLGRSQGESREMNSGVWDRIARGVMRYPAVSLVLAAGILIAAGVSYLDINTNLAGVSVLPEKALAKDGFELLDRDFFGGISSPIEIVIDGEADSEAVQAGIEGLRTSLAEDSAFGAALVEVNNARDLTLLTVVAAGDPSSSESSQRIQNLRDRIIPQAFTGAPAEVLVTGVAAKTTDFTETVDRLQPTVFAFVLGLSFLLLMLIFRSILVPLKAIIMNLLSVGAAYGILVLVVQEGYGNDFFGFTQVEAIESWLPLFMFAVLFGLSMDYHVFLLSRIRERFDEHGDNSEAIAFGIRSTGKIITGAALIMVAVFGGFAMGDMVLFQQMGFGLAVAILLDATIVRSVLVPSTMKLLGRANWYLPNWLNWLPELQVEASELSPDPES